MRGNLTLNSKPERELSGTCAMLCLMVEFKIIKVEQQGHKLLYDHGSKSISLKKCSHVRQLSDTVLVITMINGTFITLRVPEFWMELLPLWIVYIRQLPLYQVNFSKGPPCSFAYKSNRLVLLTLNGQQLDINEGEDSMTVRKCIRTANVIRIGPWILEFETSILAKRWHKVLLLETAPAPPLNVPDEGNVDLEEFNASSKLENQRLIEKYRKTRRKSIDEWEDSDEEEAHFHLVMEFLSKHKT